MVCRCFHTGEGGRPCGYFACVQAQAWLKGRAVGFGPLLLDVVIWKRIQAVKNSPSGQKDISREPKEGVSREYSDGTTDVETKDVEKLLRDLTQYLSMRSEARAVYATMS